MHTDPVTNASYNGIKRGIDICIKNECFGSAVVLIYSGIDAMAFLAMPERQIKVKGKDFISWCDKYMSFSGTERITGVEFYSARCGMVHTFGVESDYTRNQNVRKLGYMDKCDPPILFRPSIESGLVLVSIEALAEAFYSAIDRFLVDLFSIATARHYLETRVAKLCVAFPVDGGQARESGS